MSHPFYKINVQPVFSEAGEAVFRLYNFNDPAGYRLRKGETQGNPWPFRKLTNWTEYEDEAKAEAAAAKLQKYLEAYEKTRTA